MLWGVFLVLACAGPAPIKTVPNNIPDVSEELPPQLRRWDPSGKIPALEALKALKRGVDYYNEKLYASALEALPPEPAAGEAGLEDYVILYRAKSHLMMERPEEALKDFRILGKRYPDSAVAADALKGQYQALLQLKDPQSVLGMLEGRQADAETIYYQARSLDEAGEKDQAIQLYLRIYSDFAATDYSELAESYLLSLSPKELKGKRNYGHRLRRAESLLKSGDVRTARALLVDLGRVSPPDSESACKTALLRAEAEYRLRRTSTARTYLSKVKDADPALAARALYLQGACCRRLGKEDALLSLRDKALKLYSNSPDTEELCFTAAAYFLVNHRAAEAAKAYSICYEAFPKGKRADEALWKVSLYSYFQGRFDEAAIGFWKHLLARPDAETAASSIYWMGRCYEKRGDSDNARYLYRRARELGNNSYYGQLALEAEASLQRPANADLEPVAGLDFDKVRITCDGIRFAAAHIPEPDEGAARVMERARRLAAAELGKLAVSELRWGMLRYPKSADALKYIMSRVYANQGDYYESIVGLREIFPDYVSRPADSLPEEAWRLLFPMRYYDIIAAHAVKNKMDPSLILGVIRQESAFEEKAQSPAGARGLMQILPSTGRMLARQARLSRFNTGKLFQPEISIALGARYLASLLQRYGKTELALAAYNAGQNRVDQWLKEFEGLDMAEFVERIPYSETRGYVRQVISNKTHYDRWIGSVISESEPGEYRSRR